MGTTVITILKTTKGRHWEISNLPRKTQILDGYWLTILLSVIIYLLNWQKCKGFSSKHEWLTVSMLLWWSAQKCLSKETRKWRLIYISTTINSYFQEVSKHNLCFFRLAPVLANDSLFSHVRVFCPVRCRTSHKNHCTSLISRGYL